MGLILGILVLMMIMRFMRPGPFFGRPMGGFFFGPGFFGPRHGGMHGMHGHMRGPGGGMGRGPGGPGGFGGPR